MLLAVGGSGGGTDGASQVELCRRWLAALLLVPGSERSGVVSAVERKIVATWGGGAGAQGAIEREASDREGMREMRVVGPPRQGPGYVEHIETTYEVREAKPAAPAKSGGAARRAAGGRSRPAG